MNERIKLLAIEAKLIVSEYNGFDQIKLSKVQQRFAELIIRECAKNADVAHETKREWVGLTDSEVDNIVAYPWGETKNWIKAVEAALKEKNT